VRVLVATSRIPLNFPPEKPRARTIVGSMIHAAMNATRLRTQLGLLREVDKLKSVLRRSRVTFTE